MLVRQRKLSQRRADCQELPLLLNTANFRQCDVASGYIDSQRKLDFVGREAELSLALTSKRLCRALNLQAAGGRRHDLLP